MLPGIPSQFKVNRTLENGGLRVTGSTRGGVAVAGP